ncbi:MAG: hybrid sensor histidine kinase/response regulator, partial [Mariprofundaceae bacterium]|nr:hybrid sensor histidine kinase/response regulator [Mariprofundaceae bacterium]
MPRLASLRTRLAQRPDSEHEQALIRVVVVSIVTVYFLLLGSELVFHTSVAYLIASLAMLASIIIFPASNIIRRIIGMLSDIAITTIGMILAGGEIGTPILIVYLWVITGNGFRYGVPYLILATVLSGIGFMVVAAFVPFWSNNIHLVIGIMAIIIVIPVYMAVLIKKLHGAIASAQAASQAKSQFLANMSHEL